MSNNPPAPPPSQCKRQEQSKKSNLKIIFLPQQDDISEFCRLMRMTPETYGYILERLKPHISMQDTRMRKAITESERLSITLKYLSTGK